MTEELFSPERLADYVGVPVSTVYQWNYKGVGPRFLKLGRHVRYRASDVEAWLDARAASRPGPAA